jgi:hypothetical protein
MKLSFRVILFVLLFLCVNSCTVYTEKQSESLSKVVYATKDSLDAARVDLADNYASEAIRLVKPPKQRIFVESIYKQPSAVIDKPNSMGTKQRVVVIPSKFKNDIVVVVSSIEYEQLLKDKENFEILRVDHETLIKAKKEVDDELIKQTEYRDQMVQDLFTMKRSLAEKDLLLFKYRGIILGMVVAIIAGIWLRIKGIL